MKSAPRLALALALALAPMVVLAACGGNVVVDRGAGGGRPTTSAATTTTSTSSASSTSSTSSTSTSSTTSSTSTTTSSTSTTTSSTSTTTSTTEADAGPPAACTDPATCSRQISRDGCFDATTVGAWCDFFATPCSATPPDCALLGGLFAMNPSPVRCGDGTKSCRVDWVGNVDDAALAALCEARAKLGVPLDCMLD